jgi:hypothetical protein
MILRRCALAIFTRSVGTHARVRGTGVKSDNIDRARWGRRRALIVVAMVTTVVGVVASPPPCECGGHHERRGKRLASLRGYDSVLTVLLDCRASSICLLITGTT